MRTAPEYTPKEARALWSEALRSGEFLQGRGQLFYYDEDAGLQRNCCMGVAVFVADRAGAVDLTGSWQAIQDDPDLSDHAVLQEVAEWLGITGDGTFSSPADLPSCNLATLNDGRSAVTEAGTTVKKHTFAEIADIIDTIDYDITE